jgi:hypothetical protein
MDEENESDFIFQIPKSKQNNPWKCHPDAGQDPSPKQQVKIRVMD